MSPEIIIRHATSADIKPLLDIYNHYIREAPATFDITPKTFEERQQWLEQFAETGPHQCLVAERAEQTLGWACSSMFKSRAAYATSIETSVYLAQNETGQGLGHRLYKALFAAIADEDIHRAFAGIVPPNPGSVALHRSVGFELVGTFSDAGRKFEQYWDVDWYEKRLTG